MFNSGTPAGAELVGWFIRMDYVTCLGDLGSRVAIITIDTVGCAVHAKKI